MSKIKNLIPNKAAVKKNGPIIAGAALGGVATGYLNKQLPKIVPASMQNDKVLAALPLVIGAILGCNKNPMLQGIGLGIVGVSGAAVARTYGIGAADLLGDVPQYIEIEGIEDGGTSAPLIAGGNEMAF